MSLIEKIKQALCDNSPFDDDKPDDYEVEAQAALTVLIEHAGGDGVTEALRAEIERLRDALTTISHEGGQAEARFARAALKGSQQ